MLKRLSIYKEILGSKLYADVKDLASAVKKPAAKGAPVKKSAAAGKAAGKKPAAPKGGPGQGGAP